MTTRSIVPRFDGEGGIGTTIKKWLNGYFYNIFASGGTISGVNMISETGETISGPVTTSAGISDAYKLVALNELGVVDSTMVSGVSGDNSYTGSGFVPSSISTSEALSAGDLVNIYNDSGAKCRKAYAYGNDREAHGFVLTSVISGGNASVYLGGTNDEVSNLNVGWQFLSEDTPGLCGSTVASGSGNIVQKVGFATSATSMDFKIYPSIRLA